MEENFLDLLEQYLDEEEIELKKREDFIQEEQEKNIIQTESNFSKEDSISIDRYVNEFLGIPGDCSNLLHCGLKDLECDYVMGIDNNFANKNPELVHQGYLLLVIDSHNKRGTYVNPFYLRKYISKDAERELKLFYKKRLHDLKRLEQFYNEYQLVLNEVQNNEKFYNLLRENNKVKQLNKIEMRENDDKYKRR